MEARLYDINEIAYKLNLTYGGTWERIKKLELVPVKKMDKKHLFDSFQFDLIESVGFDKSLVSENIIYVHTTWHILPSKLNLD